MRASSSQIAQQVLGVSKTAPTALLTGLISARWKDNRSLVYGLGFRCLGPPQLQGPVISKGGVFLATAPPNIGAITTRAAFGPELGSHPGVGAKCCAVKSLQQNSEHIKSSPPIDTPRSSRNPVVYVLEFQRAPG